MLWASLRKVNEKLLFLSSSRRLSNLFLFRVTANQHCVSSGFSASCGASGSRNSIKRCNKADHLHKTQTFLLKTRFTNSRYMRTKPTISNWLPARSARPPEQNTCSLSVCLLKVATFFGMEQHWTVLPRSTYSHRRKVNVSLCCCFLFLCCLASSSGRVFLWCAVLLSKR